MSLKGIVDILSPAIFLISIGTWSWKKHRYLKIFPHILDRTFYPAPIYRIGGDEFCVILFHAAESDIDNRWRTMQRELEAYSSRKRYVISAAFGYVFYDVVTAATTQLIFSAADQKMHEDKGRYKQRLQKNGIK